MNGELKFKGDATVSDIAKAIGKDANTVRYMMKNNLVDWGIVFDKSKPGKRQKLTFIVNAKKFYEDTGILL